MKEKCSACEGIEILVPARIANRPGLNAMQYRVGTHSSFLETMKARLSSSQYPVLQKLATREQQDASIALLDAWATIADVLTFYQERIVNEGYLRTAVERRSILELAHLIGYRLRPGVAASVFLAFTIEDGFDAEIPAGTRTQSLPGPGELPQPFETSVPLKARSVWNGLKPRLTQPQFFTFDTINDDTPIYLDGTTTNLKPNSPLLLSFNTRFLFRVDDSSIVADILGGLTASPPSIGDELRLEFTNHGFGLSQAASVSMEAANSEWTIVDNETKYFVRGIGGDAGNPPTILDFSYSTDEFKTNLYPQLYRTLEVDVDQQAKRTIIKVQPWIPESGLGSDPNAQLNLKHIHDVINDIIARYTDLKEYGISSNKGIAIEQVVPLLTGTEEQPGLKEKISAIMPEFEILGILDGTLVGLQEIFDTQDVRTRRLRQWLSSLIDELKKVQEIQTIVDQMYEKITKDFDDKENGDVITEAFAQLNKDRDTLDMGDPYLLEWLSDVIAELEKIQELRAVVDRAHKDISGATGNEDKYKILKAAIDQLIAVNHAFDLQGQSLHAWLKSFIDHLDKELQGYQTNALVAAPATALHTIAFNPNIVNVRIDLDGLDIFPHVPLPPIILNAPAVPPSSPLQLARDKTQIFASRSDFITRMFGALQTQYGAVAYEVTRNSAVPEATPIGDEQILKYVNGLRVTAALFGHNVQLPDRDDNNAIEGYHPPTFKNTWLSNFPSTGDLKILLLDKEYNQIKPGSSVAVDSGNNSKIRVYQVEGVQNISVGVEGIALSVTVLTLNVPWLLSDEVANLQDPDDSAKARSTALLQKTRVYAQPEPLALAEMPITDPIEGDTIELAELYGGLESGRWLIVSGERADIQDEFGTTINGIRASERVLLGQVIQDVQHIDEETDLPGDHPHSFLKISPSLSYKYKPETVTIYANVVKATHGETLSETFGSGDASQVFQKFSLRQTPLTYVSAPTSDGADSTLEVRVNDVKWHEANSMLELGYKDRGYIVRIDDDGKTTIQFGDGRHGARPATGIENIKGKYRRGIGKVGNVKAEQIKLLATKPLHVKGVINPMSATGGADRESRDQARYNAPLAVAGFDRLVSVKDYEDFARRYAGIGKSSAMRLSDGRREIVHVTIAGAGDIPIDISSDLYRNLRLALYNFGDPYQPVVVEMRALSLLVISARVQLLPDYAWEFVEPKIRATVSDVFSFERRELGQDVTLSEVVSTIQGVEGVAYVDLETLDAVTETRLRNFLQNFGKQVDESGQPALAESLNLVLNQRINTDLAHLDAQSHLVVPAQISYLDPTLPDTLILTELQP